MIYVLGTLSLVKCLPEIYDVLDQFVLVSWFHFSADEFLQFMPEILKSGSGLATQEAFSIS